MDILIKVFQLILSLSILVILHELGHFIPAKLFKTRVEKFYLFFDIKFSLFKKKIGETVYGIGWLPLGGYVKISGMIDESMDKEQLDKPPEPWEFRAKPAWQRLIIMVGGVFVNIVLGVVIYIVLLMTYGEQYLPNEQLRDGIWVTSDIMKELGLETGDKILEIDGTKVRSFREIIPEIISGNRIKIERNNELIDFEIPVDFISKFIDKEDEMGSLIFPRYPFIVGVPEGMESQGELDFETKDRIVEIENQQINYYDEAKSLLQNMKNQNVNLKFARDEQIFEKEVGVDSLGKLKGVNLMALSFSDLDDMGHIKLEKKSFGLVEAVPGGIDKSLRTMKNFIKQLKKIVNPETGAYKGVGGFITIGSIFPENWNWRAFWEITAFLSFMLGIFNILPIPALDGGHVFFLIGEIVTGRKPSQKVLEYAQIVGLVIILLIFLGSNLNDVIKLFK